MEQEGIAGREEAALRGKQKHLSRLEDQQTEPGATVSSTQRKQPETKTPQEVEAARKTRHDAEVEYETALQDYKAFSKVSHENVSDIRQQHKEIEKPKRADLQKIQEKRDAAIEEHEYCKACHKYQPSSNAEKRQELDKEINEKTIQVAQLRQKATSQRMKASEKISEAESYDFNGTNFKAREKFANLKSSDPIWMGTQLGVQAFNHVIDALKSWAKGEGELQSAYWNAQGQIFSTYNQMIKAGLDSAQNMGRDAYQQAGDLAQTLIKMSDQESQSMHWAA